MATIGNSISADSQKTSAAPASNGQSGAAGGSKSAANQSTFLQLLVAQLKNQNPAQPMEGTAFVTQLAQFSDLEQNLAIRQDLDAISAKFLGAVPSKAESPGG